jgi:hypothetical protein
MIKFPISLVYWKMPGIGRADAKDLGLVSHG